MEKKEAEAPVNLPYFDRILEQYEDAAVARSFGEHVHWGYWDNPAQATLDVEAFHAAAERLTAKLIGLAAIQDGEAVLDVGCGFGGTISSLNKRFAGLKISGLNIDCRQLEIARQRVHPANGNTIDFVCGDAVRLPYPDNSFDVLLAVECIFHFSSRRAFFQEASRVLKAKGRIAFSDFVPAGVGGWFESFLNQHYRRSPNPTYGDIAFASERTYQKLIQDTGLSPLSFEDVSKNVYPTYAFIRQLEQLSARPEVRRSNNLMQLIARLGLLKYLLFSSGLN